MEFEGNNRKVEILLQEKHDDVGGSSAIVLFLMVVLLDLLCHLTVQILTEREIVSVS